MPTTMIESGNLTDAVLGSEGEEDHNKEEEEEEEEQGDENKDTEESSASSSSSHGLRSEDEKLLRNILYSIESLMGENGQWRVFSMRNKNGIYTDKERDTLNYTVVSKEEVLQFLGEVFGIESDVIGELLEEIRQCKRPDFLLNLTVIEADIECQKDSKEPTNSHIRIKTGPILPEQFETTQIKDSRHPVWKQEMQLKVLNVRKDYFRIELWHEKQEDKRKRRHFISKTPDPTRDFLLAELPLKIKDTLDSGISGWYTLENRFGTNMDQPTKVLMSGQVSRVGEVDCDAMETYNDIFKRFLHLLKGNNEEVTSERGPCAPCEQETVSSCARAILDQHALVLNLSQASQLLSWWSNVTLLTSPLDWQLLLTQFNQIKASLVMGLFSPEEQQCLKQSVSKIVDRCINCLKNLDNSFPVDFPDRSRGQLEAMLQTMKGIQDHPKIKELLKSEEGDPFCLRILVWSALQGFSQQWWSKISAVWTHCSESKDDLLRATFTVTNETLFLLCSCYDFYDSVFMKQMDFCCLKVVYQTVVKDMMQAIEPHVTICCQSIPVSTDLIGEGGIECDFLKGSFLLKIYKNLIRLCGLKCSHMSTAIIRDTGVENYHTIFNPGVENQLSLTTHRELQLIKDIVLKDTLKPVGPQTPFSASLLEATAIPHRMKIWWFELVWPNVEDRVFFLKKILRSLIYLSTFYCSSLVSMIDYITQESDTRSQHLINEKVCVTVINMVSLMKEMKQYPNILGYKFLESKTNGEHTKNIQGIMDCAITDIEKKLERFMLEVIDKRQDFLEMSIINSREEDKNSVFFTDVLYPTIDLLRKMLKIDQAKQFLELLWNSILKITRSIVTREPLRDLQFYGEMVAVLQKIAMDLTHDSEEALDSETVETQEYKMLVEELQLLTKTTSSLICSYYHDQQRDQQRLESILPTASLVVRTWFKEDGKKLVVHILMAKDVVVPPEEAHKSPLEYFVKVQIMFEENPLFRESSTQIIKEDPATFNQEFEFDLDVAGDGRTMNGGVILLTLKDHNKTRSNTFLGESYVSFSDVPQEEDSAQNMYLWTTFPTISQGCQKIMHILGRRQSDKYAKAFLRKLKTRRASHVLDLLKNTSQASVTLLVK